METVAQLIFKAGGPAQVAKSLGIKRDTIYRWQTKNAIPQKYWLNLSSMSGLKMPRIQEIAGGAR